MFKKTNRISIIGGCGTGKTTLANNLGKELNLPVIHLDGINYFENWVQRDKKERDKIILNKIKEDRWIIDGTYRSTLEEKLKRSDCIIYLDYSTISQLIGVLSRRIRIGHNEKEEIKGCKEQLSINFLIWVLKWRKDKRPTIINAIKKHEDKKIIIFKNRRQLNNWYKGQFEKEIKL